MEKIGLVYSDEYLKHITANHPESPERLKAIISALEKNSIWKNIEHINPRKAEIDELLLAHNLNHIKNVINACKNEIGFLDMDTQVCKDSYDVALLAAGGVMKAVDVVMKGDVKKVFCAVRPPGHHSTENLAMGFCLFNNVALGAKYAINNYKLKKVMIIDWDLHHGNGTQEIFYDMDEVFYISLHQYPHYPGTGSSNEIGTGKGKGFTLNLPMSAGSGEREYLEKFNNEIKNAVSNYKPEIIFISAGFDAHWHDPLGSIKLESESYYKFTRITKEFAEKYSSGRIVSVLEGGYNLKALSESVIRHLQGFL